MSLTVLGAVSDPGRPDKANEDGYGAAGRFAWIIDGATGLGDEALLDAPSDAAWLTAALDATLKEHAARFDDPAELLALAAARIADRFAGEARREPAERYEIPTAAILLAAFGGEEASIVELGDCGIYLRSDGATARYGGTVAGRAKEQENAKRLMGGGGGRTPDVLQALRRVRNLANTAQGYAIFAPDPDCARRARRHLHRAVSGEALFVTDGFEAAVDDYALYSEEGFFAAAMADVEAPLKALRQVEADDPDCVRFPRFKPSDDATAMVVRFG